MGGQQEGGGQDQDQPWAKRAKPITQQRFTVPGNTLTFGGKNKFKVDGKKCRGDFQVHSIGDVSRVVTYKEGCNDVVPAGLIVSRILRSQANEQQVYFQTGMDKNNQMQYVCFDEEHTKATFAASPKEALVNYNARAGLPPNKDKRDYLRWGFSCVEVQSEIKRLQVLVKKKESMSKKRALVPSGLNKMPCAVLWV